MSIKVMGLVWPATIPGPASRKAVLLRLADHAHDDGGSVYPSVPSLAAASGMSRRTAASALRDLEQLGAIVLVGSGAGGRSATGCGIPRHYQIDLGRLRELQPIKAANSAKKAAKIAQKAASLADKPSRTIKEPSDSHGRPIESFEEFWRAYPSRQPHPNPKKPARHKFDAAVKRGVPTTDIIRGAVHFAKYVAREQTEPEFIAQAITWLSQDRWTEYQTEPKHANRSPNPQPKELDYD